MSIMSYDHHSYRKDKCLFSRYNRQSSRRLYIHYFQHYRLGLDCWIIGSNGIPWNLSPVNGRQDNNREIIASFLESRYHKHYRLFNLTEEVYDSLLFDCSVYYDSFA